MFGGRSRPFFVLKNAVLDLSWAVSWKIGLAKNMYVEQQWSMNMCTSLAYHDMFHHVIAISCSLEHVGSIMLLCIDIHLHMGMSSCHVVLA